jgi:hypothetical protein
MELQVARTQSLCVILSEGGSSSFLPRQLNIMETRLRKTDVQCDPVTYLSTIHEM